VGGAFDGIEKLIQNRIGKKVTGFGAEIQKKSEKNVGEILRQILPTDLLKYGLIPEFVGRLPVIVTLDALDHDALVNILTQPKNALVKQYEKLLEMDGVALEFKEDALKAIAEEAIRRNTGARGLRAIMEEIMMNVMYDLPTRTDVTNCIVTKDTILRRIEPELVTIEEKVKKEESA
jgi:ATP-dependent Clp protease ATP-binding subunit ClpX